MTPPNARPSIPFLTLLTNSPCVSFVARASVIALLNIPPEDLANVEILASNGSKNVASVIAPLITFPLRPLKPVTLLVRIIPVAN